MADNKEREIGRVTTRSLNKPRLASGAVRRGGAGDRCAARHDGDLAARWQPRPQTRSVGGWPHGRRHHYDNGDTGSSG